MIKARCIICHKEKLIANNRKESFKYCSRKCKGVVDRELFLGSKNPMKSKTSRDKVSKTVRLTHWTRNLPTEEVKRILKESAKRRTGLHWKLSQKTKDLQGKAKRGLVFTKSHRENISKANIKRFKNKDFKYKGYFFSQKNNAMLGYRSSFELVAMHLLEQMTPVLDYRYEELAIPYVDKFGNRRFTIPDFVINYRNGDKEIVEVKPNFKITKDLDNTTNKLAAMKQYAAENDYKFSVWTEDYLNIK